MLTNLDLVPQVALGQLVGGGMGLHQKPVVAGDVVQLIEQIDVGVEMPGFGIVTVDVQVGAEYASTTIS